MTTTVSRNPTGDEAVSGTWTGTAGSRYTLVDDYPDTAGTDQLIHGTTAGNLTFTFTAFSIPSDATNISLAVLYYDAKNGAQASNVGARLKLGSSYFNSSTHNPTNNTYVSRTDTFATNPATSAAWTPAQINGTDPTNPLNAFGWNSTDASPTVDLTSIQLNVTYDRDVAGPVDKGTFTVTGNAATLQQSHKTIVDAGSYTLTGNAVTLTVAGGVNNPVLTVDAGTYVVTSNGATLTKGYLLTVDKGTYTLTGQPATLSRTYRLPVDKGTYTLTGNAATLNKGFRLLADAGAYVVTGNNATLRRTYRLTTDAGAYVVTGNNAALLHARLLSVDNGTFLLTGQPITTARGYVLPVDKGTYLLTGRPANLGTPVTTVTRYILIT